MKTTTLAIIVVLTAMILVTAGALNSPALAAKSSKSDTGTSGSSESDTGTSGSSKSDTGTSGSSKSDTGTSGGTSGSSSSSVSKQLKALTTCLTSASKLTGALPTRAQFTTCESQANFGTLGGSAIGGSAIGGAKTSSSGKAGGGGLVPSTSGVAGPSFLGTTGKAPKTSGP